jgi:hypothetical protein
MKQEGSQTGTTEAEETVDAETLWRQAMFNAEENIAKGRWMNALPQVSCAMDTAVRMLAIKTVDARSWVRKRSASMALMTLVIRTLEQQGIRVSAPRSCEAPQSRSIH